MRTNYLDLASWRVLSALLTPANALVCEVMLTTGLRVSDVLRLRTASLASNFTVLESKTGKLRSVSLSESLLARLTAQAGTDWVFTSPIYPTQHRTRQAVWYDIKRAAKAMRIPLTVAPHSARKTYAVGVYERTGSLDDTRQALNHDSITTTLIYLLDVFNPPKADF